MLARLAGAGRDPLAGRGGKDRIAHEEDITFVNWVMHATGKHGPFELTGIDRVRVRDGLVAENLIVFDTAAFARRSGKPVPWA